MAWSASIESTSFNGNTLTVGVSFTDGSNTFVQTFSTQSIQSDTWIDDQAKAVIDNLTNLEAYAATLSADQQLAV